MKRFQTFELSDDNELIHSDIDGETILEVSDGLLDQGTFGTRYVVIDMKQATVYHVKRQVVDDGLLLVAG